MSGHWVIEELNDRKTSARAMSGLQSGRRHVAKEQIMKWPSIAFCAWLAAYAAACEADPPVQRPARGDAVTPGEKYRAVERDALREDNSLDRKVPRANLRKERDRLRKEYAGRMLDLAATYPDDPAALDALGWVFGHVASGQEECERALESLTEYAGRALPPEMVNAVARSVGGLGLTPEQEPFLRETFMNNRHRLVRATAGHRIAYLLKQYSKGGRRNPDPMVAANRAAEAERLYEKVIAEYGDVRYGRLTFADSVRPELFELRDLAIGKTVPEIEGEDLDGVRFKLSDYR